MRRTEKPPTADEIFSTGNTDRRITAQCRLGNGRKADYRTTMKKFYRSLSN
jgi:hypothetical protein